MEKTKRLGIIEILKILKNIFSSEPDIEDYENVKLPQELSDALSSIDEKTIQKGFNATETEGGFAKKINPKTEEAMRAMHSKVARIKKVEDIERE